MHKKKIEKKALSVIDKYAEELKNAFKKLKQKELLTRGNILYEIRAIKGITQKVLAKEIKAKFPEAVASQSTISRIENHEKLIDPDYAKKLSKIFKVDSSLFMPSFFYN